MTKRNLTALPFFNSECGAIVVIRSEDENILVRMALQLTLESGVTLMPTTVAEAMYGFAQNLRNLYHDFEVYVQDNEFIAVASGNPDTLPLQLLGRAARKKINQRFVGIIGKNHDSNEYDWKRLRTEVNECGQKIAINFFCFGKKDSEINSDFDFIADYLIDAQEVNGEIVLTPEDYGGEPFPDPAIRLTIDPSNEWCPYEVKV